jgi:tRNA A-37 threonylcarbamoyl transferase component Bud32
MFTATTTVTPPIKDKLYTLETALNESRMEAVFVQMMRQRFAQRVLINDMQIEIIRRRNQRCVLRYVINAYLPKHLVNFKWRVIGKVYKASRGERVYADMLQIWENGFSRGSTDGISIPEPLDFSPSLCMLFQEEVPGLPLKTLARQSPQPAHFRQLARTLAKLHRCPLVLGKPFNVQDHLSRCHPTYGFLELACPELADAVDHIVKQAHAIEADFFDIAPAPLHGDFHLGQVHLENGKIWLIDFDALSYGDPAADLGNVLVFLRAKSRRHPEFRALIQAFVEEYFSQMNPRIAHRIPLYEALTHLRRACKALRLQEEGWRGRVARMIKRGVAAIEFMHHNGHSNGKLSHLFEACTTTIDDDVDWDEFD